MQRLKIAIARQIFLGRGTAWAEVQLDDVPFRVLSIRPEPPEGEFWTYLLCEIGATSRVTGRKVPYVAVADAIESERVRRVCETYSPGRFMTPGSWH